MLRIATEWAFTGSDAIKSNTSLRKASWKRRTCEASDTRKYRLIPTLFSHMLIVHSRPTASCQICSRSTLCPCPLVAFSWDVLLLECSWSEQASVRQGLCRWNWILMLLYIPVLSMVEVSGEYEDTFTAQFILQWFWPSGVSRIQAGHGPYSMIY